jgi:PAS domain S-box-containing protein
LPDLLSAPSTCVPTLLGCPMSDRRKSTRLTDRWTLIKVTGVYLLVSYAWIFLTDSVLMKMHIDPGIMESIAMCKGALFVTASATFLYILFSSYTKKYRVAESSLLESEQQFRAIFDTASIGIAQADPYTGKFLRVNRKMCEITGYEPDELMAMRFLDITYKDDIEQDKAEFERIVRGEAPSYRFEKRYVRKNGELRWVNVNVTVVRDAEGKPLRSIAAIEDIAERKTAEEALKHSHDLMRYIIEHNRSAIAVHDRDLRYIYVSQRYLDDYKIKDKNIIGKHHYEVFPDLPQKWRDVHQRALAGEIASAEDDPYLRSDGTMDWTRWECRPWYQADGNIGGIIVYTEVITARKQAERELVRYRNHLEELVEERTRQLQLALSSGGFGVWVWTQRDDSFAITPELAAILGLDNTIATISRNQYRMMVHPDDIDSLSSARDSAYNGQTDSFQSEYRIFHAKKGYIWVFVTIVVEQRDAEGKAARMIGLLKDISEQKNVQARLKQYSEKLEEMVTQRTEDVRRQRDLVNRIAETSPVGIIAIDGNGKFSFINKAAEQILGIDRAAAATMTYDDRLWHMTDEDGNPFPEEKLPFNRARLTRKTIHDVAMTISRADGQRVDISISAAPVFTAAGEFDGVVVALEDITTKRSAELEREITIELLRIADLGGNTSELIRHALTFFQKKSGCEAVGIRLKNGDDYPYYEARGFPDDFLLKENSLCLRDEAGEPVHDSCGNPILECMCGNIICGRFDPSKPFFTAHGSFWSNCTTDLLAGTTEKDRQSRTRNRCNGEGYESVALIPIHVGGQRLGLLQLNDHRKDRFTPHIIALWERLADYLAAALARYQTEDRLAAERANLQSIFDAVNIGMLIIDDKGRLQRVNEVVSKWTGKSILSAAGAAPGDFLGCVHAIEGPQGCGSTTHCSVCPIHTTFESVLRTGQPLHDVETCITMLSGKDLVTLWLEISADPLILHDKRHVIVALNNITVRKNAEEALQRSELQYRSLFESMTEGFALHEMLYDENGKPSDYRFLQANPAFEKLTGLKRHNIIGKTLRDIAPDEDLKWIDIYAKVAATGQPVNFEHFSIAFGRHYEVYAYSPAPRYFAALFVDVTERKQAQDAVQAHRTHLRELASQLSLAEERERRKIAVQLHDRIGHSLTLAKMKAEEMSEHGPGPVRKAQMAGLVAILEDTINASSSLTFELSSPILYELGLEAALHWLAEHTLKNHGLKVTFADDDIRYPLSQDRSVLLFQVVREIIFNVAKHAHATHAVIMVNHTRDAIVIHITDDGQGFDPDAVGPGKNRVGGFGIFSIRERLTSIGGEFIIRSSPGCGTHVRVSVAYD